jgi:hypothetical protein
MRVATAHLLVVYAVLGMPLFARVWYEKAKRQIAAGDPDAKLHLYHKIVVEQVATTAVVLGLSLWGWISAASLGLNAPRSWEWNIVLLAILIPSLLWSAFKLRPKAEKVRKQLDGVLGALIPGSPRERCWWGTVSIGAGISEELVFRGFLFYYLGLYLPQINTWETIGLTSLIFGVAHFYQGKQGVIGATILGLIAAAIYVMSGSLLVPIVLHAVIDWRLLLMLPPEPEAEADAIMASGA